ncbi:MAG TPA: urease accessory protein UreD [Burkholderiales bacterium]|nr:urease accessory protein UreD [Burkholderiales bacterium]
MRLAEPLPPAGWRAALALDIKLRGTRSVLAGRPHDGPLVVQKPQYPEGDAVCHAIVVHPPGGIAGGDELELTVRAGPGARALLTTPGAGKWYRTAGPWARQRIALDAGAGTVLEWLPQETIVFENAAAELEADIRLAADARFIGWEIIRLGRTASGGRVARGRLRTRTSIRRDGRLEWLERARLEGGWDLLDSPLGLAGEPVFGTMLAAAPQIDAGLVAACRAAHPGAGSGAVTCLPGVLVVRYLGASSEAARDYFARLWAVVRPVLAGREPVAPRIWQT